MDENGTEVSMKLKEFYDALTVLVKENKEILEYDVIYSCDDEGNDFQMVHYTPAIGNLNGNVFNGRTSEDFIELGLKENCICIN